MSDTTSPLQDSTCFLCGAPVTTLPQRYPSIACKDCRARAVNRAGEPVRFGNESMSGGFLAYLPDGTVDKDTTYTHTAYIDGTEVFVNEGRFGGTVIEPIDAMPESWRNRSKDR